MKQSLCKGGTTMDAYLSFEGKESNLLLPTSKSITHRYLLLAYLNLPKVTRINHPSLCQDTECTYEILKKCGLARTIEKDSWVLSQGEKETNPIFNFGESGSSLRFCLFFLLDLFGTIECSAAQSLISRITKKEKKDFGFELEEKDGHYFFYRVSSISNANDDASTQWITGLCFEHAFQKNIFKLTFSTKKKKLDSYLIQTLRCFQTFSYDVCCTKRKKGFLFHFHHKEKTNKEVFVPTDMSSALNLFLLGTSTKQTTFYPSTLDFTQNDAIFLKQHHLIYTQNEVGVTLSHQTIKPFTIDLKGAPDCFMVLAILASTLTGTSHLTGLSRLVHKESNRKKVILDYLTAQNISYSIKKDTLSIVGKGVLSSYVPFDYPADHRIVLALAVLSSRSHAPVKVTHLESVEKSYPTFWKDFIQLGGKITQESD
jgi:3-phosphoshikimate 1-carboxyvinyltransferase